MHHIQRSRPFRFIFAFWIVFLSLLIGVLTPHSVLAAAYIVSKTADTNDGVCNADCSLREAITAANASAANDTITFAAGANGTITLTSALPALANNGTLTITGNGAADTIISGNKTVQVFYMALANVTLDSLTVTAGVADRGGGIFANGSMLTVINSTVSDNVAIAGGGIDTNSGKLTLINSTISRNRVTATGGGIFTNGSTLLLTNSIVSDNRAASFGGGILTNGSTLLLTNSIVSDNRAVSNGGGIDSNGSKLTLINGTISRNRATTGGGIFTNGGMLTLFNTIIANSIGGDCAANAGDSNARNSLIEDGLGCINGTNTNNLIGDPALNSDLTLQNTSIAINAGDNSLVPDGIKKDLAGNARISQNRVDIGAYESTTPIATSSNAPVITPTLGAVQVFATTNHTNPFICEDLLLQNEGDLKGTTGFQNNLLGGIHSNIYCRHIVSDGHVVTSLAEIGVQSIINLDVVEAVDIYGLLPNGVAITHFETPVHICLHGIGEVFFLNASTAPRRVERMPVKIEGDYRCADVINAGTLVLVGSPSGLPEPTPMPAVSTLVNGQCSITTLHSPLNLRTEPNTNAAVLTQLPYNLVLQAIERVPGWYRVIYLDRQGWINADYVSVAGDCG